ncbi:MAG TPA: ABC transporter substrate-binding protein [Streptosporangiaceae bacterium]
MNHRSIKRRTLAALAASGILAIAACSSSGSSSPPKTGGASSGSASTGMGTHTLVVESTALSPLTKTFNPFDQTSTGYQLHSTNLYYEPTFFFNILNPNQPPVPMLATSYSWSDGGKTLTLTTRSGVKWSDGQAFSAADVAFTFNLLKKAPSPTGAPTPDSATASGPNTVVLKFSQPETANLFLIGTQAIVAQHVWQSISNPATYADATPVGTGPYVLDKFTPQGILLKANPNYWNKSAIHVPEVDFPSYTSNTAAQTALTSGQIDWAGNDISNVQNVFVGANPSTNHTWLNSAPYLSSNNVVTLWLNVTKAPLNDPKVRQAISYAINRQQLSTQGETGYELPASSSSGLLLPVDSSLLAQSFSNDLPATGNAAKVSQILTSDGYTKVGGKWTKNGQPISFSIEDPTAYTDYYTDAQLLVTQLNAQGIAAKVDGVGQPTQWSNDAANGTFDAMIHWSNNGPTPYFYFDNWMDYATSAPVGKAAAGDYGRFNNPQAQAALAQYTSSTDSATQQSALNTLQNIMSTQVPEIPLLYGAAWAEWSSKNYTGWPTQANAYSDPGPNPTEVEYVILHLTPTS